MSGRDWKTVYAIIGVLGLITGVILHYVFFTDKVDPYAAVVENPVEEGQDAPFPEEIIHTASPFYETSMTVTAANEKFSYELPASLGFHLVTNDENLKVVESAMFKLSVEVVDVTQGELGDFNATHDSEEEVQIDYNVTEKQALRVTLSKADGYTGALDKRIMDEFGKRIHLIF